MINAFDEHADDSNKLKIVEEDNVLDYDGLLRNIESGASMNTITSELESSVNMKKISIDQANDLLNILCMKENWNNDHTLAYEINGEQYLGSLDSSRFNEVDKVTLTFFCEKELPA